MIFGYVETIERGSVRGWVYDKTEPARRLSVELLVDGVAVQQAPVNISRPDLAALNIGRSNVAFNLTPPPRTVLDVSRLGVRVIGDSALLTLSDRACAVEGTVETVTPSAITGWAWHLGFPQKRLSLEVWLDGKRIATGSANLPRTDLVNAGVGDGRYGYRIPIAASADQLKPGRLHIFDADTGKALHDPRPGSGSAKAVRPATEPASVPARPSVAAPVPPSPGVAAPPATRRPPAPTPRPPSAAAPVSPAATAAPPIAPPAVPVAAPPPPPPPPPPTQPEPRIRVAVEPATITLSQEAAEALIQALRFSDDDEGGLL